MLRPGADVREAELLQKTPQAHFRQIDAKTFSENALQIDAAPANHAIRLRVGTGFDQLLQGQLLRLRELRGTPRRFDIDQPVRAALVEAMHPIPQRLAVHPADPCRRGAVHPVMHCCKRQQPTRLRRILRPRRKPAQFVRIEILP